MFKQRMFSKVHTVEPGYNEVHGTMKISLLYQVSHYIRIKKQRNIKSRDQPNYLVIRVLLYPTSFEVPLYMFSVYLLIPTVSITNDHLLYSIKKT